MSRRALWTALLLVAACKKTPPQGDLPPSSAPPPPTAQAAAPANPHAESTNPHAGGMSGMGGAQPTAPHELDKLADGRLGLGPFSLVAPAGWTAKPVTSSMRAADFVVPGADKASDAELIVYYFGNQGAGSVESNLDRWLGQLDQPDGKPTKDVAKIEKTKFGGQDATYVSANGHFKAQAMMPGAAPQDINDAVLLAAIVDSPSGPYYFKLVCPKPTADAQTKAFRGMLESLKLR